MRRALGAALAAVVLVLSACSPDDATPPPGESDVVVDTPRLQQMKADADIEPCEPGQGTDGELPDLTLDCLGGGDAVDLSTLQGPLIINLWASYCGPCREEMPALQAFYEKHGDRVGVLGIDWVDPQPDSAIALAELTGATYPQLADPDGDLLTQRDVPLGQGSPQFVIVDAEGNVVAKRAGGLDSEQEVVDMVSETLGIDL